MIQSQSLNKDNSSGCEIDNIKNGNDCSNNDGNNDSSCCSCNNNNKTKNNHNENSRVLSASRRKRLLRPTTAVAAILLLLLRLSPVVIGGSCSVDSDCPTDYGLGSVCTNGNCSNPFEQGCLKRKLPDWHGLRVCNSDDPLPAAAQQGLCRIPEFDYLEIRIHSQNWESVFFEAWILQIVLSEMLDVPTTIETGTPDAHINFYDPTSPFEYGISNDWGALERADVLGDCRLASRDPNHYESCAHVITEVWDATDEWVKSMVAQGILAPVQGLGALGQEAWFLPKFTGERDPSLITYVGLQGEQNRRKLAETFLRPTTWKDYCQQVSLNNCTIDDGVAKRPPQDDSEYDRMFVDGLYIGHFRFTDKNNCTKNPTTCTGHIADYPCGWSSFVTQQTFWLNIALESDGTEPGCGGYPLHQMQEMWPAANATQSNFMMMWWSPERLYQEYLGTEAEFNAVLLPPPTQACIDARITPDGRCSNDTMSRVGSPAGVCMDPPNPLGKVMSQGLYYSLYNPKIPEGFRSPAYDVLNLFEFSSLQLGELFDYWREKVSPREAICQWVVDNLDTIKGFVPSSYPRVLNKVADDPSLLYTAMALGGLAAFLVLVSVYMVYRQRHHRVMLVAQIEFLFIILAGAFLITMGAIVAGIPPTSGSCIAEIWLILVGYTLELVPLIVKVAAINRLMQAARHMRRVVLTRANLFGAVALITAFVLVYLSLWTALDPPRIMSEYTLTQDVSSDGETVVLLNHFCSSSTAVWRFLAVGWTAILLLCASVLAFQTRNLQQDFNESQTLAMMAYSHFVFVILIVITYFLSSEVSESTLSRFQSFIYSVDTMASIIIYFIPKFLTKEKPAPMNSTFLPHFPSHLSGPMGAPRALNSSQESGVDFAPHKEMTDKTFATTMNMSKSSDFVKTSEDDDDDDAASSSQSCAHHHVRRGPDQPLFVLRKCRCCGELESEPLVIINPDQVDLDEHTERLFI